MGIQSYPQPTCDSSPSARGSRFLQSGHIRYDNNKRVHTMNCQIDRLLRYAHLQEFPSHFRGPILIERRREDGGLSIAGGPSET